MYRAELGCISHPYVHLCIYSHAYTDKHKRACKHAFFNYERRHKHTHTSITVKCATHALHAADMRTRARAHTNTHAHTLTHPQPSRGPGGYLLPRRRRLCVDVSASENQDWGWPPRRPFGVAWGGRGPIVCICAGGARYLVAVGPRQGMCAKCAAAAGFFGVCNCV